MLVNIFNIDISGIECDIYPDTSVSLKKMYSLNYFIMGIEISTKGFLVIT